MPLDIILPRVDMDMATGTISKWLVKDGDRVAKGAPIFEIETDKAAMEIEAPGDGVIGGITAAEGSVVPVGAVVALLYAAGETPAAAALQEGIRATPLARRLARERGVTLERITGSGPRGRIVAGDIPAPAQAIVTAPPAAALSPMRRTIAERLTLSKQTIPHFYLTLACDLENLFAARERIHAQGVKLSLNDFMIKALALALQKVPSANATWNSGAILRHTASDIGVAVAVEDGLYTPVIRAAEVKPLAVLSAEMKALAEKARARKLSPADCQGGATSISNLGMHGIEAFSAIINPPQSSILATGAATEHPVRDGAGFAFRRRMHATLSCDHRVIDGAVGAALLGAFKRLIEDPVLMLA